MSFIYKLTGNFFLSQGKRNIFYMQSDYINVNILPIKKIYIALAVKFNYDSFFPMI